MGRQDRTGGASVALESERQAIALRSGPPPEAESWHVTRSDIPEVHVEVPEGWSGSKHDPATGRYYFYSACLCVCPLATPSRRVGAPIAHNRSVHAGVYYCLQRLCARVYPWR